MRRFKRSDCIYALADDRFDLIYPLEVREVSLVHWTPVIVARQAANFLVRQLGARALDIGCGPGKFCIVGALTTDGRFTGVEQRKHLCDLARIKIKQADIWNAEIIHGNVMETSFAEFDAFYLFNPFEENLKVVSKIDSSVNLSTALYGEYIEHVAKQLAMAPLGTRVATYCGRCEEIPIGYECLDSLLNWDLKFWEKTKHYPVQSNLRDAPATNNTLRLLPNFAT